MKRISLTLPHLKEPIEGVLWTIPYELCQYGINAVIVWDMDDNENVTKTLIMNILGDHPMVIKDNNPPANKDDIKRIEEKFNANTVVYSAMMGIMPNMLDKEQGTELLELLKKYREDALDAMSETENIDEEGGEPNYPGLYG